MKRFPWLAVAVGVAVLAGGAFRALNKPPQNHADYRWAGIQWLELDEAIAQSKLTKKPVFLLVSSTSCVHCRNYSWTVTEPQVSAYSDRVHFALLDGDLDIAEKYAPDGPYVPRVVVLAPGGQQDLSLVGPNKDIHYFPDEFDPDPTLELLERTLAKYPPL